MPNSSGPVSVYAGVAEGFATTRNGVSELGRLHFWTSGGGIATVDFVSRAREVVLNAGARVNVEALDQACLEWCRSRGLIAPEQEVSA